MVRFFRFDFDWTAWKISLSSCKAEQAELTKKITAKILSGKAEIKTILLLDTLKMNWKAAETEEMWSN